jgi:hypothetical protein
VSIHFNVRSGTTPSKRLCDSCNHAVIMQGESQGERIWCHGVSWDNPAPIKDQIVRCSAYSRKESGPSLSAMTDMAFILTEQGPMKTAGFVSPRDWRKRHQDESVVPDEATRRLV